MRRPALLAIAALTLATAAGCSSASQPGAVATTTLPPPTAAVDTGTVGHPASSTSTSDRPGTTTTTRAKASGTSVPATTATTKPKATTTTTAADTSTSSPCAVASEMIVHVTSATLGGSDSATLTATPVVAHCGGPDDVQYVTQSSPVEHLLAKASTDVEVMTITDSGPQLEHSDPVELVSFLAKDTGTRDFVVDGSTSEPSGLTELYHP